MFAIEALSKRSGYAHNRAMLENTDNTSALYVLLKFVAIWFSTWAGVSAGIFAPSLPEQQLLRIQHSDPLAKPDAHRAEAAPGH